MRTMIPFGHLSTSARMFLLLGLIILGGTLFISIAFLILMAIYGQGIDLMENIQYIRIMQISNQVGIFIVPPILFALLTERHPKEYLGFIKPSVLHIIITVFLILSVGPVVSQLMQWNETLSLPEQFGGIEKWMRSAEETANEIVERILSYTDPSSLVINLIMIALLPAIGEELLFRATAIRLFNRVFKNVHASVWVAAILFSAFHLQFFGFLPRMFLGLLFGYLFVWSGSIWVPFTAHLINNGVVVVISWLYGTGYTAQTPESLGGTDSVILEILSIIITTLLLLLIYNTRKRKSPINPDENAVDVS